MGVEDEAYCIRTGRRVSRDGKVVELRPQTWSPMPANVPNMDAETLCHPASLTISNPSPRSLMLELADAASTRELDALTARLGSDGDI